MAILVTVQGEVDLASAEQLARAGADLADDSRPVILDLEKVTFMDSSGLRCLLDFERQVTERGMTFALLRPSSAVTRLLDLVDLRHRFNEIDSIDASSLASQIRR